MKPPLKPPKRDDYERLDTKDWVYGRIEEIQYDEKHNFGKWPDEKTKEPREKIGPAVRFRFSVDGYEYPHYSRWGYFSYGQKSNLYNKYLSELVEDAKPDMDFNIYLLEGMKVKMLWSEKNNFQSLDTIRSIGDKLRLPTEESPPENTEASEEDETPF